MIRNIEIADCPVIRMKAEALAVKLYPELIPDVGAEHALLSELRGNDHHYARAIGGVGTPQAVLLARGGGNLWATRRHATVLLWYSEIPGAGYSLLTDFRRWVDADKRMALAGFTDDFGMDARLVGVLRRAGFIQRGGTYVHFPRGSKK